MGIIRKLPGDAEGTGLQTRLGVVWSQITLNLNGKERWFLFGSEKQTCSHRSKCTKTGQLRIAGLLRFIFSGIRWSVIRHAKTRQSDSMILASHMALTEFEVLLVLLLSGQV